MLVYHRVAIVFKSIHGCYKPTNITGEPDLVEFMGFPKFDGFWALFNQLTRKGSKDQQFEQPSASGRPKATFLDI